LQDDAFFCTLSYMSNLFTWIHFRRRLQRAQKWTKPTK